MGRSLIAWALVACRTAEPVPFAEVATNVLVLVLDDVGTDQLAAYGRHPDPPPTPRIDALAEGGLLFEAAWSYPVCSPARAAMLTGRMGRRTGLGDIIEPAQALQLPLDEILLPEALPADWSSVAIGKWHLAGGRGERWRTHAMDQGFDAHRGSPGNLAEVWVEGGEPTDYYRWERLEDGVLAISDTYATTAAVDDALDWLGEAREPWLGWIAFNAAHGPFQDPPRGLATPDTEGVPGTFGAMLGAMDAEIGRLLDGLDPEVLARTLVVAVGDNGTPPEALRPPADPDRAKGTLYEGGVSVPLIVWGAGVARPGRATDALVHVVDLFPTVLGVAGVDPGSLTRRGAPLALDGQDLAPLLADDEDGWSRELLITEMFGPAGPGPHAADGFAVRDHAYKWFELRLPGRTPETHLFDLRGRTDDGPDLLGGVLDAEAQAAGERLRAALADFEALPYDGL